MVLFQAAQGEFQALMIFLDGVQLWHAGSAVRVVSTPEELDAAEDKLREEGLGDLVDGLRDSYRRKQDREILDRMLGRRAPR